MNEITEARIASLENALKRRNVKTDLLRQHADLYEDSRKVYLRNLEQLTIDMHRIDSGHDLPPIGGVK